MSDRGNRRWPARFAAALLIALPILVLFGPVLIGDRSLAIRDAAHFYHPLLKWTTEQWRNGGPPLWNPYENTGMPLLADASSSLFYPGRLLLFVPVDFAQRYNLYVAAHVVLAALGSYLLARRWQASSPAAACAAIAYSCGGSVVFQHSNVVYLVGAAWLPFAAWAIDGLLSGRSWRAALGLGVVLALMVLGGDPQMAYHVVLIGALYGVISVRRDEEAKERRFSSFALGACRNLGWLGAASVVGAMLSAVQVLPSLEAAAASDRAYYDRPRNVYEAASVARQKRWDDIAGGILGQPEPTTHHERLYDFSVAPWRLVECLWPNVGGRMFPTHRRWLSLVPAEGRIWAPSLYFGILPLLLALTQWRLWRAGASQAWLSWLLLLFTLGSFGWYGLGWCVRELFASVLHGDPDQVPIGSPVGGLYWLLVTLLPGYASFRYPAKLLVVAVLAASQLAARGFDQAAAAKASRLLAVIKAFSIVSVVLLVLSWIGFTWLDQLAPDSTLGRRVGQFLAAQRDPSLGPFDWRGCQRDVCFALFQAAVVGLGAHWLLRRAGNDGGSRWHWALVALIAVDLAAANYWLVPAAPAVIWRDEPAAAAAIHADAADQAPRVYRASLVRWRPDGFAKTGDRERLAQIAAWERDTLFPKYGLPFGISLVESYGSLKPVDYESLLFVAKQHGPLLAASNLHELPHPAVLHLLGTQYLVVPRDWQLNEPGESPWVESMPPPRGTELPRGVALWRVKSPLPRAWIVHQVEALPVLKTRHLADVDGRTREVLFPPVADSDERPARDFLQSAVVETDFSLDLPRLEDPARGEECRIVGYGLDHVQIEAALTAPGLVVLSDLFAPGWSATVETEGRCRSVPILRTNRVCRGVWLPAGKHRIEMVYRPPRFYAGAWISGIDWAAVVIFVGLTALRAGGERR
ncbi:MAG TPA: YfhO family protein [Pirellulaceae bacterium]|nr:YfhO family protein [Pirellulaceae bacterium]